MVGDGCGSCSLRWRAVRPVDPPGEPALAIGAARALFASPSGDLWLGGPGGVSRLRAGRVTNYGARDGVPERVIAFLEDHEGILWAGGFVGLSRFRDGRWEEVGDSFGMPQDASVTGFYEDHDRTLWITTSLGTFSRVSGSDRFSPVLSDLRVRGLCEDASGAMWALTDQSIRRLSGPALEITLHSGQARMGPRMLRDSHGSFWIGDLGSE